MRTIATTALLLTLIAVGAAPAAQAHGERARDTSDAREIQVLAKRLDRATDALRHDARRAAGRLDRHEARALEAIRQLEQAADELHRQVVKRGSFGHEAERDFRRVERAYRSTFEARRALFDGRRGREVRRDFQQVDRLIAALDESFHERHRIVRHEGDRRPTRIAHR